MFRLLFLTLLARPAAHPATAILNAIADQPGPSVLTVEFRAASAEGWKVSSAKLMLHVASGPVPTQVRIAAAGSKAFRAYKPEPQPEGWVRIAIDPKLIEAMAAGKTKGLAIHQGKTRFHGLDPAFTQPYILIEGQ